MVFVSLFVLLGIILGSEGYEILTFPGDFKIGVATSAYQIEGGWNVSDKGLNLWDHFTHEFPSRIDDRSNGDIAADSYHKYKEDVAMLKDLGVDFYRLSLSWSRILPTGFANKVSMDGVQYYKNLLDELISQGIEPFVTIYHFDHPQVLQELGGWTNELMVTWFADYARVVFRELGDRVKMFATINEPNVNCNFGYGDGHIAPGVKIPRHGPYVCMHNMIKAHAKAYRIYDSEFRSSQGGQIGIVISCNHNYPKYLDEVESAEVQFAFNCGWAANPIYSEEGDYPAVMRERIAENSRLEGHPRSRLPEFSAAEIDEIRGSADYFGLNHYTTMLTEPVPKLENGLWYEDSGVITSYDPIWPMASNPWQKIVPQGFGDLLRHLNVIYGKLPIYVMENGMSDDGSHLDFQRTQFLHDYLRELLIAVNRDNCNVKGYAVWSFLDNFEWAYGYTHRFGLVGVDFDHPDRPRTPKLSYKWYQELIRSRHLPPLDPIENVVTNSSNLVSRGFGYRRQILRTSRRGSTSGNRRHWRSSV